MPKVHSVLLGKLLRHVSRLRGGGSALPGLVVERFDPMFLADSLGQLPRGVVVISGTNGKTTTTKMVTGLLEACGLRVFTNRTGSNFTRGVVSALVAAMDSRGNLPFDIAVLELDEAHAVQFVRQVQPRVSVFLNVSRDQLDRFGEIDQTAKLLQKVAAETTGAIVLNRDDPLVQSLAPKSSAQAYYFGVAAGLKKLFPSDDALHGTAPAKTTKLPAANVLLQAFDGQDVTFEIAKKNVAVQLKIGGFYNFVNAAAALAAAQTAVPEAKLADLFAALATIEPAFGRGERIEYGGSTLEIILVKNPSGFRLALAAAQQNNAAIMIAINDNYADGRDMSWLWDVDFSSLQAGGVAMVSGVRAYDMALRLQYDEVRIASIETDLATAFREFLQQNTGRPMRIYCTYTAMLRIRNLAEKQLKIGRAL
ncbi:MAG TPA: MurT ligase domain-containing protein [Candidatus Saccharimonas sp.]|nr:MurT ligase domain-containing protein [Candidatus Saccharimonas sp.]